ncbi:MAG: hypothetical protein GX824_05500 [Clostridiales bacterium]|jgi:hypothetical protein|nr:hypothetical protein [Clostridiales bacterium]
MTKRQYLEARIAEVNDTLKRRTLSINHRKSQLRALQIYSMDLEREIARDKLNNEAEF